MAKSPARRLNSLKPNLVSAASSGSRTSASNSSSASAVDMMPSKKSLAAISAFAARALGDHRRVERRRHQAPFRGRIGMRQAAAKRAAHADRIMRDVARDEGQQRAERAVAPPACETRRGARARRSRAPCRRLPIRSRPSTSLMSTRCAGLRQPERHDRHQALPAGQHAAVLRRDLRQNFQRLVERARHMADEGRGFHAGWLVT